MHQATFTMFDVTVEHPDGCERGACEVEADVARMRLPDGQMQVQGRYVLRPGATMWERVGR